MKTAVKQPVIRTRPFKKNRFSWWKILAYIVLPFYKLWLGLVWIYELLLCETKQTHWNGIIGPGGRTYRYEEFSWGKLSFVISIIGLVLIILFGLKII